MYNNIFCIILKLKISNITSRKLLFFMYHEIGYFFIENDTF